MQVTNISILSNKEPIRFCSSHWQLLMYRIPLAISVVLFTFASSISPINAQQLESFVIPAEEMHALTSNNIPSKALMTDALQTCLAPNLCFANAINVTSFPNSNSIDVGYINSGSNLDFVVGSTSGDNIRIKLGCGNGRFCGTRTWSMGDGPIDVMIADFNNDGKSDVISPDFYEDRIRIRWGHSNLSSYSFYSVGDGPMRVTAEDLNNDGHDDFAVVNGLSENITVGLRNMTGGFVRKNYSAGDNPRVVEFSDCNGDGDLDMIYATSVNNKASIYVRRNKNTAPGEFGDSVLKLQTNAGFNIEDLTLGDYNEDGNLDLIALLNSHKTLITYGNGNCRFGNHIIASVATNPTRISTTDFNLDGHLDFVIGHSNTDTVGKIAIYLGNGTGNFSGPYKPYTADGWWVQDLGVGDFNGDSKPDIVFTQGDGA